MLEECLGFCLFGWWQVQKKIKQSPQVATKAKIYFKNVLCCTLSASVICEKNSKIEYKIIFESSKTRGIFVILNIVSLQKQQYFKIQWYSECGMKCQGWQYQYHTQALILSGLSELFISQSVYWKVFVQQKKRTLALL